MNNLKVKKKYIGIIIDILHNFEKNLIFLKLIKARAFSFNMTSLLKFYNFLNKNFYVNFKKLCKIYNLNSLYILPHSSFYINLCHYSKYKLFKNINLFIKEISICYKLGLNFINFHPGFSLNILTFKKCITNVVNSINYIINRTEKVILLIENSAGQGTSICYTFESIAQIINLINDKSRIGVCLDICHMFASGYKISNIKNCVNTFNYFNEIIGLKYLKGIHLSGSKYPFSSKKDRHASLFHGYLDKFFFPWFMNNIIFNNIPIILETNDILLWEKEISWLYSL